MRDQIDLLGGYAGAPREQALAAERADDDEPFRELRPSSSITGAGPGFGSESTVCSVVTIGIRSSRRRAST